ncbi:MAG: lysylphosphatidylglycerol synthase transmembrane domain-containing protein [Candidatus Omnitrophota bacterium]
MTFLKKAASLLIRLAISAVLLSLLFKSQKIDIPALLGSIMRANKPLLAASFTIALLNYALCFYRWKMLLDASNIRPPLKKIISSFSGGIFFNSLLPSTVGGDVVRSLDLSAYTRRPKEVIATVLLDRLSGYVGLVGVILLWLLLGWRLVCNSPAVLWSIAIIALLLAAILLVLFNSFLFSRINSMLHPPRAGRIRESLKNLHQELHYFRNHKRVLFKNAMLSAFIQAVYPLSSYLIALALGVKVSIIYFLVFIPIIGTITLLPVAIGGLGLRENMFVFYFRQAGVPEGLSVAVSLVGFGFLVIHAAIGGLIYVLTVHHRRIQRHSSSVIPD